MRAEINHMPLLRLDWPELYQDEQFKLWLNGCYGEATKPATWHTGVEPGEWSDVFITYCEGDGSNSDMPEHCWQMICREVEKHNLIECFIWLSNVGLT